MYLQKRAFLRNLQTSVKFNIMWLKKTRHAAFTWKVRLSIKWSRDCLILLRIVQLIRSINRSSCLQVLCEIAPLKIVENIIGKHLSEVQYLQKLKAKNLQKQVLCCRSFPRNFQDFCTAAPNDASYRPNASKVVVVTHLN